MTKQTENAVKRTTPQKEKTRVLKQEMSLREEIKQKKNRPSQIKWKIKR
ncbi:MAG: hypothetical protein Q8760_01960 [Candidatus Phytoplasma australasiaticum]|nr:hypothetical protein [Candidatus Phytoplasma australasiaticum]